MLDYTGGVRSCIQGTTMKTLIHPRVYDNLRVAVVEPTFIATPCRTMNSELKLSIIPSISFRDLQIEQPP